MPPVVYRVDVMGLAEFKAAIKQMDANLPKHLRVNLKKVADVVVGKARAKMPNPGGESAMALKPTAGTAGVQPWAGIRRPAHIAPWVKGQDVKGDHEPWLDFGGSTGRGHRSGVTFSGSILRYAPKGGNYLYPAISETAPILIDLVDDAIGDVAREAGFDIRGF